MMNQRTALANITTLANSNGCTVAYYEESMLKLEIPAHHTVDVFVHVTIDNMIERFNAETNRQRRERRQMAANWFER